jgi:hypothetical protein
MKSYKKIITILITSLLFPAFNFGAEPQKLDSEQKAVDTPTTKPTKATAKKEVAKEKKAWHWWPWATDVSTKEAEDLLIVLGVNTRYEQSLEAMVNTMVDESELPKQVKDNLRKELLVEATKKVGWHKVKPTYIKSIKKLNRAEYEQVLAGDNYKKFDKARNKLDSLVTKSLQDTQTDQVAALQEDFKKKLANI